MRDTVSYYYYIDRKALYRVVNILEAYEGLAIVRTIDKESYLNEIQISDTRRDLFEEVMDDLADKSLVRRKGTEYA